MTDQQQRARWALEYGDPRTKWPIAELRNAMSDILAEMREQADPNDPLAFLEIEAKRLELQTALDEAVLHDGWGPDCYPSDDEQ